MTNGKKLLDYWTGLPYHGSFPTQCDPDILDIVVDEDFVLPVYVA
jgi:hypothetical protein